ncbi:MAG TPA: FKBP-type peptidyl-prolyl cis-trans isomerase [Burkholderiaceae bacterium]|nr:FKBP-type peptidyl-prolyl cis-trans isomerase [Burkholderiaceae bacterium]
MRPYAFPPRRYLPFTIAACAAIIACASAQAAGTPTVADAAKAPGAVTLPSGVVYQAVKEGSGASPAATDTVKVNYRGTFMDGREFDSSAKNGGPASFPLNRVIKCWTDGVQKMKVGGKAKLTCPADVAYGSRGAGGGQIPPDTPLQFDVELLSINGK